MSNFTYQIINNEAVITKYNGSSNLVYIPDEFDGFPVTTIGDEVLIITQVLQVSACLKRSSRLAKKLLTDATALKKSSFRTRWNLLVSLLSLNVAI
jgi:hypothetical protein